MSLVPNAMDSMVWALSTTVIFNSICAKFAMILERTELCCLTKLLVIDCVVSSGRAPSMIGET